MIRRGYQFVGLWLQDKWKQAAHFERVSGPAHGANMGAGRADVDIHESYEATEGEDLKELDLRNTAKRRC